MTASKICGNYQELNSIAGKFTASQAKAEAITRSITADVNRLRGGDWVGRGASKFYEEMDAHVVPGMHRLAQALGEAARVTGQINQLLQQAEAEAARILDKEPGNGFELPPDALGPGGLLVAERFARRFTEWIFDQTPIQAEKDWFLKNLSTNKR
jgi:WXG100 family type VII secretion target